MDRFIGAYNRKSNQKIITLKSNMDRFIVHNEKMIKLAKQAFKIQYG